MAHATLAIPQLVGLDPSPFGRRACPVLDTGWRAAPDEGVRAAESSPLAYVDPVASLCLVIGAVVGLIGGVRVYIKWNSGDQDINKELMGWGGSCLFLVLVSVIIKAFFGV